MRKRILGLGVCLAATLAFGQALADTRTLQGGNLTLTLTGDDETTIETDPSLSHSVRVVADSVDCLDGRESGGEVRLSTAACADSGDLAIKVPPNFPVSLTIAGSGNVHVGDLQGPLTVTLASSADLTVRHATILQLSVRGSGDTTVQAVNGPADITIDGSGTVKLGRLDGPLQYVQHGSGDLVVTRIEAPAASFDSTGSGDTVVAGGHIAMLHVATHGNGDFAMGGTVGNADLQASGGADIRVPHVSGQVQRNASGGSTITVGEGGIGDAAMKLAASASDSDDDHDSDVNITVGHSHHGFWHFIAGIAVLGILVAGWRTLSRNGGLAGLRTRFAAENGAAPVAPSHPGVAAFCDKMADLERRMARVETHVTSREFELNQKFRDIDAGSPGR